MTAEETPRKLNAPLLKSIIISRPLVFEPSFELELALVFFNQATLLTGNFKPFPYMTLEKKLEYLTTRLWSKIFRSYFSRLKEVCFLCHYALEENAKYSRLRNNGSKRRRRRSRV